VGPQSVPKNPERFFYIMAATKNIIFDLGGVLLDIDYQKTIIAFEKLGLKNFEAMFSQFKADDLFEKLETGHISETDFYVAVKERTKIELTNEEIDNAWNALILNFRPASLDFLEKLSANYKLFLLSNTNSIHLKYFKNLFMQQTGKPLLDVYFNKAWYSNEVGLRKPGTAIFEFVLQEENLKAGETLFIDDTLMNIETAQKLGFKTHHFLPTDKIECLNLNTL
jgi:glucose-1-phosphatase